jgi:hypothetical protein
MISLRPPTLLQIKVNRTVLVPYRLGTVPYSLDPEINQSGISLCYTQVMEAYV